jgi:hypothetical protein
MVSSLRLLLMELAAEERQSFSRSRLIVTRDGSRLTLDIMEDDGPLPIRRLQEALVNRIAAGEVLYCF